MHLRFRRRPLTHEITWHEVSTYLPMAGLILFASLASAQGVFESKSSGGWGSSSTWTLLRGADPDTIPDANDTVAIRTGHTVTIGGTTKNCANLTVDAGGILSVDNAGSIRINANPGAATINGTVTVSSSGTLQETGTGTRSLLIGSGGRLTLSGTAAFPAFDVYAFDANSTVAFTASADQNVQSGIAYGNLTLGGSGKKTVAPRPSDTLFTSNGTLTIATGVTFDISTNILYVHFNGNVVNDGTLDASVGTVVVEMHGAFWTNNGTYLRSITTGFGYEPTITFYNTQIGGSNGTQKFYDLCFKGNATALVNIDSARNIDIRPGAVFNGGVSNTLRFTGNWMNNGTYVGGTTTVSLIGTSVQTVGASTFGNLVVNNPAGVTLAGNVGVSAGGTFTLVSGTISTGAYALTINNPAAPSLVLGSNRISGTVTRAIAGGSTGTYRFLCSDASVTPNGIANPSSISMTEFPNTNPPNLAPGADTDKVVRRYYSVTQSGAGSGFFYSICLPYLQSEVRGNEALYVLFCNGGSGWTNMGSAMLDTAANYVEQTGLISAQYWTIAEGDVTLPIQLTHFMGAVVPDTRDVLLTWQTISETDNYGFVVQRSTGNQTGYADLPNSFVPGHGTTVQPHDYGWSDLNVDRGTYYYRLKQIDLTGTVHFTEGIQVEVLTTAVPGENMPAVFRLEQNYPNPFNPSTTIEFTVSAREYTTLMVYNLVGQRVATLFDGMGVPGQQYTVRFDGGQLSNGTYFAKLVSGKNSALQKLILLK